MYRMHRILARLVAVAFGLTALTACADLEPSAGPVAEREFNQLSGGPGVSVYHFLVDGVRAGSVMVTDGVSGGGYIDQYEYWAWEGDAGSDIRDGKVDSLSIDFAFQDDKWTQDAADAFEAGTDGWISYAIPRSFELQWQPRMAKEDKKKERFVYQLTAPAWGGVQGDIRYYVEIDFTKNAAVPTMEWLVDADDLKAFYASEEGDDDADDDDDDWTVPPGAVTDATRWEVRLTEDAQLLRVSEGWAYELTTLYPPE